MKALLQKIEKELALVKDEKERIAQAKRLKELWMKYEGDDRIISSHELQEELIEERKKQRLKIKTNIPRLDEILDGFREGNLIVVSAPTKQGKTTLCQTFTIEFAKDKVQTLWFSYEVPLCEFMEKFQDNIPLFYIPKQLRGNTMTWLEERIVEGIAKFNIKVIFIDHLHYIVDMNARNQNMSLQIGEVMRTLKRIALKYGIIIFIIAHIKHIRISNAPHLEDLRDSSFIGQEADIVLMMTRNEDTNASSIDEDVYLDTAKLWVKAHRRTGKTGRIDLMHQRGRFYEIANYDNN